MQNYLITALVTTYNSERYIRGLLEDLQAQTIADKLEIVIVDSNSPQNERVIVEEFQKRYDNIVYIRTDKRETSHASWNHCIHAARGKYLTIACTDDRHRPDAFELMVQVLEEYPEFGLVYADSLITNIENETFERNSATKRYDWPDYNLGTALSSCIFGPQPVWRRDVHKKAGYFDPALWIAGDHDLFIKIAWHCGAVHLRETLGLFLQRDDSNSGRKNREDVIRDVFQVMRLYREKIPITDIYPQLQAHQNDPFAMTAALWHFGNLCALSPYNDFELAMKQYLAATNIVGLPSDFSNKLKIMFSHNAGILLYCLGEKQRARDYLKQALDLPAAQSNLNLMDELEKLGKPAIISNFNLVQFDHPVTKQACLASGLRLDNDSALVRTTEHEQIFWDVYVGPNGIPVSETEKNRGIARQPRQQDESASDVKEVKYRTCNFDTPVSTKSRKAKLTGNHVLHILMTMYGWADEGGGTIHPRQVAKALVQRGHRVTVVYTASQTKPGKPAYYVEENEEDGVQLFAVYNRAVLFYDLEYPEREIADPEMQRIMNNLITNLKPDIVNYASLLNFSAGIIKDISLAGIAGIYTPYNYWPICPRMYLFQDDLALCGGPSADGSKCAACVGRTNKQANYAQRTAQIQQIFNSHINRHLAVSHRVRQIFVQNGYKSDSIHVLHQPSATTDCIWQQVGISRKPAAIMPYPLKVGFIGSLLSQKGVHVLVEALQAFQPGQVEGHIFGFGPEPYLNTLQLMDKKGLVHFHEAYNLNQLPALLKQVDVIIVPSIWEDCAPFVVQEALAARCPVIGSRIGGIPEFIEEGENGYIFNAGDSSALADILFKFINDPTLLGRMQGKIQPPNEFSHYLDNLIAHYNQVIAENSHVYTLQMSNEEDSSDYKQSTHQAQSSKHISIQQKYSLYHLDSHEEIIKDWISTYAKLFIGVENVLDLGCGPGLFLDILKNQGTSCVGFDFDPEMVKVCQYKGLNAKVVDARMIAGYHEEFGGIHLGHVIEHLHGPSMVELLESCTKALRPGGLLLIRTPNWQNENVRNGGFWLDYTHVRPYPLELIEQIYSDLGLQIQQKGYEPNGWNDIFILGKKPENSSPVLTIVWEGSQFVYHSLALINRELCLQLIEAGHELSIIPYEPDEFEPEIEERFKKLSNCIQAPLTKSVDVHIRHQWPPVLTAPPVGHWVIIQPWEFGSLPEKWVKIFSTQVDEMWVPSNYVRQVYIDSGVPAERVFVVPNGINPEKFHPEVSPYKLRTKKKFKFLFVGGTIHRKGIDLLLDAYCSTFKKSDDVCLVIKDMGSDSFYQGRTFKEIIKKINRRKNAPAIEYIDKMLPEEKLVELYTACDVFVHPNRGEGFGLPILEAMACGLPAIVTNGGACLDFCNNENSLLVNAEKKQLPEKRIGNYETVGYPWFCEVDIEDLKKKMLFAFKHKDEMQKLGKKASRNAHGHWTWKQSAIIIQERINKLKKLPVRRKSGYNLNISPHNHDHKPKSISCKSPAVSDSSKLNEKNRSIQNELYLKHNIHCAKSNPLVSAIVSTYNSERFMHGCLEDLEAQSIADQLEIVIVDSNSPQNERAIIEEFQQHYDNIIYTRNDKRESTHATWNRCIKTARGKYIALACTDDRHKPDAFERMVAVLEARPDIALVYPNVYITKTENETFEKHTRTGKYQWFDFDPLLLLCGCFVGPQPMWRKSLHEKYGYLDGSLETTGDWEFWLRLSESETFLHIDEFLGLYLYSPTSSEHRDPELHQREGKIVQRRFIQRKTVLLERYKQALLARSNYSVFSGIDTEIFNKQNPTDFKSNLHSGLKKHKPVDIQKDILILLARDEESNNQVERCVEQLKRYTTGFKNLLIKVVKANPDISENALNVNCSPKTLTVMEGLRQGIVWEAQYVVLLLPNTHVTKSWLRGLLSIADSDPSIAAVGPAPGMVPEQNSAKKRQGNIEDESPKVVDQPTNQNDYEFDEVPELASFCLLLKSEAVRQVGGIQANSSLRSTLSDLYQRLQTAGFKLVCAKDVFVQNIDYSRLTDKVNQCDYLDTTRPTIRSTLTPGCGTTIRLIDEQSIESDDSNRKNIKQNPSSSKQIKAMYQEGSTLVKKGQLVDGLKVLSNLLELRPNHFDTLKLIGDLYQKLGKKKEAHQMWELALAQKPNELELLQKIG